MSTRTSLSTIAAIAALTLATPLFAQERSTVSSTELESAAAAKTAPSGEAVRQFMATERMQNVAGQMGIDATDLSARVAALDDATLARLAQQGGLDDQELAGGGSEVVVISTSGLIIILLLLILLTS